MIRRMLAAYSFAVIVHSPYFCSSVNPPLSSAQLRTAAGSLRRLASR
jgi:hypothetical protein